MVSLGQRELEEEAEERREAEQILCIPTKKETFLIQVNKDTSVTEMKMWGQDVIGQGGSSRQGHLGSV